MAYGAKRSYGSSYGKRSYGRSTYGGKARSKGASRYGVKYRKPLGSRRLMSSRRSTGSKSIALKKTREFLWGTISAGVYQGLATNAYTNGSVTIPNNQGGSVTTSLAGSSPSSTAPIYTYGLSQQFALLDIPTGFVDFVSMFEEYKIDKVRESVLTHN